MGRRHCAVDDVESALRLPMSDVRSRPPHVTPDLIPAVPPRTRRWPKITIIATLIVLLLFGGGALGLYKYAGRKLKGAQNRSINVLPAPLKGPLNILVLGSDSRQGLTPREQKQRNFSPTSGRRSDTIILVHLYGDGKHAVVLSFPRDLRVHVPGLGIQKINAAYNKGPNLVIQTIKEYTGIPINHYVEVNFAGFREIVNSLGGVRICPKHAYHDPKAGLFIPKRGCYMFDGNMALGWARSRSVEPDGDFGRIRRQQQLIRVMMSKATSAGIIFNPLKAINVIDKVTKHLVLDPHFTTGVARALASRLKEAKQANGDVDFRVVPSHPKTIGGVSYVVAEDPDATGLFKAIKADTFPLPPYGKTAFSIPDPSDVTVRVINATGDTAKGTALKAKLKTLGFDVLQTVKTQSVQEKTFVYFTPGDDLKAKLVADQLPDAELVVGGNGDPKADVTVVLGTSGTG
ncbi:MAG: LCP family protein [Actinomycetota bacterium]|nr:LCP family protein [Actinomycetota bacterium]